MLCYQLWLCVSGVVCYSGCGLPAHASVMAGFLGVLPQRLSLTLCRLTWHQAVTDYILCLAGVEDTPWAVFIRVMIL